MKKKLLKANNFDTCNHIIGCIYCGSAVIEQKPFNAKEFMKQAEIVRKTFEEEDS